MPKDRKPAPKKRKMVITFDDKSRSDYITGFHKRKQQRRIKAQTDIAKKLKQKVREERNKKRKAVKKKADEILAGVYGLDKLTGVENEDDGVIKDGSTETLDFEEHQVFVKSDFNFEDAGFMGVSAEDEATTAKLKVETQQKQEKVSKKTNVTKKKKLKK